MKNNLRVWYLLSFIFLHQNSVYAQKSAASADLPTTQSTSQDLHIPEKTVALKHIPVLSQGITAYQQKRWMTAMRSFLEVLKIDPQNVQAHLYMTLIAHEIDDQRKSDVEANRLLLMTQASKSLDENRFDNRSIDQAILDTQSSVQEKQKARWHDLCRRAVIQNNIGDLPAANDLVFEVLADDPSNQEAQQILSDLQSSLRDSLAKSDQLDPLQIAVYKGFYAYGQAEYELATAAWAEARQQLELITSPEEAAFKLKTLHFERFERKTKTILHDARVASETRKIFEDGVVSFQRQEYESALDAFRKVALANTSYPNLAFYLVQSEAAAELKRTRDWSQEKRHTLSTSLSAGIVYFEKGQYQKAKSSFDLVLTLDPNHPQAKLYLQQIDAQSVVHSDPVAAQQHYEAGLIAYASGLTEQAIREWRIALRLDPENPKVASAINKVLRETRLSKELI